eukprot:TRINITY_DN1473_c0_g1_i1.p2 TRINITY_DN1473_c0_g1~~TRINITY_DN1473_c0_g1_i1.p2  ORF type:complete len:124 (+),score=23.74 TRINITY_DN1473_c0_g1_i1:42-374(+)
MDVLPGDGNVEALNALKEGSRRQSVQVTGDEWMYELEVNPVAQALVLESYNKALSLQLGAVHSPTDTVRTSRIQVEALNSTASSSQEVAVQSMNKVTTRKRLRFLLWCCA